MLPNPSVHDKWVLYKADRAFLRRFHIFLWHLQDSSDCDGLWTSFLFHSDCRTLSARSSVTKSHERLLTEAAKERLLLNKSPKVAAPHFSSSQKYFGWFLLLAMLSQCAYVHIFLSSWSILFVRIGQNWIYTDPMCRLTLVLQTSYLNMQLSHT